MKVYIFGNRDYQPDAKALDVADKLKSTYRSLSDLEFIEVKPNQDVPFVGEKRVVIMDVVEGIDQVTLITQNNLHKLILPPRSSAHEYDLGFQLKYLLKLKKLNKITILGLPARGRINYNSIHSIFKKLVAQDMQGS